MPLVTQHQWPTAGTILIGILSGLLILFLCVVIALDNVDFDWLVH